MEREGRGGFRKIIPCFTLNHVYIFRGASMRGWFGRFDLRSTLGLGHRQDREETGGKGKGEKEGWE